MGIVELLGIGGGIVALLKAREHAKAYETTKGDDVDGIRDGLVVMKNGLFLRGLGLGLMTLFLGAVAEGMGALRVLVVVIAVVGGALYTVWPQKTAALLAELGNTDEEIAKLRSSFALYTVAMSCFFVAMAGAMSG